MTEPDQFRKPLDPTLEASLNARQMYLAAIRRCDAFLRGDPGDTETHRIRFWLQRAFMDEARAAEPYRHPRVAPETESEKREAWGK
jgi:hypothetical protein